MLHKYYAHRLRALGVFCFKLCEIRDKLSKSDELISFNHDYNIKA
jgi:hypothetical protein